MDGLSVFKEFGLLGLVVGSIILLLFFVIKWTLKTTKDILEQAAKERESWVKALVDQTKQARTFHESVKEAHAYQRIEHEKLSQNQDIVCRGLTKIEKALGRINGYK